MAKQQEIAGTERVQIPELTEAAEDYVKVRDKRMKLTEDEVEKKESLIAMMKKHRQKVYRDDELEIFLSTKDNVKVKRREDD